MEVGFAHVKDSDLSDPSEGFEPHSEPEGFEPRTYRLIDQDKLLGSDEDVRSF